ncbi:hypothetical protein CTheo_5318 [Ceratobasidium theobromae]|uniref:Uncharacterized protein n=1 Tax=Ceratobasidium theobromae TaxID=1582974 RepID=A0A5N5QIF5_9AGAM|nr:hypothetical protein CTheo_5318 [Ceratobasidium theobromae]
MPMRSVSSSSTLELKPNYRAWIKPPHIAPFYFSIGSYQVHGEINRETLELAYEVRLRIGNMRYAGHLAVGSGNLKNGLEPTTWDAKAATGSLRLYLAGEDEMWIEIHSESKSHGFIAADDIGAANGKFMIGNIEIWDE